MVALAFRSLLAPLVVVGIAAVGYLVYLPVLTLVASAAGFEVPGQLEPVLLALLLGVVTDYCVLFFSHASATNWTPVRQDRAAAPERRPAQRLDHRCGRPDRGRRHHRAASRPVRDLPRPSDRLWP